MNEFLQAVQDGDLLAAKAAFDSEMKVRTHDHIAGVSRDIMANAGQFETEDQE